MFLVWLTGWLWCAGTTSCRGGSGTRPGSSSPASSWSAGPSGRRRVREGKIESMIEWIRSGLATRARLPSTASRWRRQSSAKIPHRCRMATLHVQKNLKQKNLNYHRGFTSFHISKMQNISIFFFCLWCEHIPTLNVFFTYQRYFVNLLASYSDIQFCILHLRWLRVLVWVGAVFIK